jgi:hypothetical protein
MILTILGSTYKTPGHFEYRRSDGEIWKRRESLERRR